MISKWRQFISELRPWEATELSRKIEAYVKSKEKTQSKENEEKVEITLNFANESDAEVFMDELLRSSEEASDRGKPTIAKVFADLHESVIQQFDAQK